MRAAAGASKGLQENRSYAKLLFRFIRIHWFGSVILPVVIPIMIRLLLQRTIILILLYDDYPVVGVNWNMGKCILAIGVQESGIKVVRRKNLKDSDFLLSMNGNMPHGVKELRAPSMGRLLYPQCERLFVSQFQTRSGNYPEDEVNTRRSTFIFSQ